MVLSPSSRVNKTAIRMLTIEAIRDWLSFFFTLLPFLIKAYKKANNYIISNSEHIRICGKRYVRRQYFKKRHHKPPYVIIMQDIDKVMVEKITSTFVDIRMEGGSLYVFSLRWHGRIVITDKKIVAAYWKLCDMIPNIPYYLIVGLLCVTIMPIALLFEQIRGLVRKTQELRKLGAVNGQF